MHSHSEENYLKSLYKLSMEEKDISLSAISMHLGVSLPSANNMIKKLHLKGLVAYEKYKPIQLTSRGLTEAGLIVRKHRLTEMFLVEIMGFGWEDVHDIAEQIEHITSESFFSKMDELLGFPEFDPHGSPIPDIYGQQKTLPFKRLSDCDTGSIVSLMAVRDGDKSLLEYLNANHIELGIRIGILRINQFDGMLQLNLNESRTLAVSRKVADRLLVR